MADLEKIIRPHLPANIAPSNTTSKCQSAPPNIVAKFSVAPNVTATTGGTSLNSISSSWSAAYKKYMTKQEKEKSQNP